MSMTQRQIVVVGGVENMGAIKKRRSIFVFWIETRGEVARGVLYRANLVEGFREGVVQVEVEPMPAAVVQSDKNRVIVRNVAVRPDEKIEHAQVVESGQLRKRAKSRGKKTAIPKYVHVQKEVGHVEGRKVAGEEGRHTFCGSSNGSPKIRAVIREQILKPRLSGDGPAGADFGRQDVVGLGKGLARDFVLEHEGGRIEVGIVEEVAGQSSDVTNLQQHVTAHFALEGEVNHVATTNLGVIVIGKAKNLREGVLGNYGYRLRSEGLRRGDRAVHTNAEDRAAGSRIDTAIGDDAVGIAGRRKNRQGLRKSHAKHGYDDAANGVDAVIGDAITRADDGLAVAKEPPEEAAPEGRIPGYGEPRGPITI